MDISKLVDHKKRLFGSPVGVSDNALTSAPSGQRYNAASLPDTQAPSTGDDLQDMQSAAPRKHMFLPYGSKSAFRLKRSTSITDSSTSLSRNTPNDVTSGDHCYQSPDGSQQWSRPSSGRPRSAASMIFTVNNTAPTTNPSGDELIQTLNNARFGSHGFNKEDGNPPAKDSTWETRKKLIVTGLVVFAALLLAALIATIVVLTADDNEKKNTPKPSTSSTQSPSAIDTTTEVVPTTNEPTIIIDDDTGVTYGGSWLAWSDWAECSASCAVGFQTRTRICGSAELACQGVDEQQRRCNTALCPVEAFESIWSTWNAWDACSQSCDVGQQIRERLCVSVNDSSVTIDTCIGDNNQTRGCNEFLCPDCSQVCTDGTLSSDCSYCICSNTINGQILSDSRLPLANVSISPLNAPYITLAISTTGGMFTIDSACASETYLFTRAGYVDTEAMFADDTANITMQTVVNLQMVVNPSNSMSVSGESLMVCCEASGSPAPDYYEWMKDGTVVATEYTGGGSTYTIQEVSLDDTGYFACRASNDYSAIYSAVATVLVRESADEFCSSQPQSNIITLPDGCSYENSSTIDKGVCESNACHGEENEDCSSASNYCCGPTSLSTVQIECDSYSLPVFLITSCGCGLCTQTNFTIYGFAGSRNGDPLYYGDIYWNGTLITNTSDDGTFSFTVDTGASRASVLFVDSFNRTFMDSTYVFEMPTDGTQSQYARVLLLRRGQVSQINSSSENTIEVNSTSIDIPPDSFYTPDGQLYTGNVVATVTTIDPSNIEELASAPGDFSMVDDEGDNQPLLSFGMFAMVFEDDSGERLSVPGEITITIPAEALGNTSDPSNIKVWTLNPSTGLWVFASDLTSNDDGSTRRKRQIQQNGWGQQAYSGTVRGISIDVSWFNFDAISSQTCVVKVRLFENDNYLEADQLNGGSVTVVLEDSNGYNSLSTNRVQTDSGDGNGHCMVLPCETHLSNDPSPFRGYIFADFRDEELVPAPRGSSNGLGNSQYDLTDVLDYEIEDKLIKTDFNESLIHDESQGPFYMWERKWRYSTACSGAEFQANHFRFSRNFTCLLERDSYDVVPKNAFSYIPVNLLLWYDFISYFPQSGPGWRQKERFTTCYIKVLAPRNTKVQAISYIGDENHLFHGSDRDVYGVRQDCATSGAVCLEVRPPGMPRTHADDTISSDYEERTLIGIKTLERSYPVANITHHLTESHLAEDVLTELNNHSDSEIFWMYLTWDNNYDNDYGIYCNHGSTPEVAELALQKCRHGSTSTVYREDTSLESWAVEFGHGYGTGMLDIVVNWDRSNGTREHDDDVMSFLETIFSSVHFGIDGVLVAPTRAFDYYQLYDLNVTGSYSGLFEALDNYADYRYYRYYNYYYYYHYCWYYSRVPLINSYNGIPRDGVPKVIIHISDGEEGTGRADYVIQNVEPLARILLVGTTGANWTSLGEYNSYPEDRFEINQPGALLRRLRSLM